MNKHEIINSNFDARIEEARLLRRFDWSFVKQEEYDVNLMPKDWQWEKREILTKTLRGVKHGALDAYLDKVLAAKMHNNESSINANSIFGNKYPRSAFFTLTNELTPSVIIEFNKVIQLENCQIPYNHTMLRDRVNFIARNERGWKLRSGHYGQIKIPENDTHIWVALIDSLQGNKMVTPKDTPEYPIVMTLLSNDIVPIASDGKIVPLYK